MAQRKIKWSLTALQNKLAILDYWFHINKSPTFPDKLNNQFNKALVLASIFPFAGIPTEKENIRFVIVRDYKLYYEIYPDEIKVLTVWDSRRNPENLKI